MHKQTGLVLAVKIYEKFTLMNSTRKKSVIREVCALQKLNHPNVVKIYDVIETPK